jgi:hypothetical protein
VSLRDRVRRLTEARLRRRPDHLGVLVLRPGESVVAGQERAAAAGFHSVGLVVPAILSAEEWERVAIQQQTELLGVEASMSAAHPPPPAGGHDSRNDRSGTPRPDGFVEVGDSRAAYRNRSAKLKR